MTRTKTQTQHILDHLGRGESLTALIALQMYGVFRLAARVKDLRNLGYPIKSRSVKIPRGTGSATVAAYYMEEKNLSQGDS